MQIRIIDLGLAILFKCTDDDVCETGFTSTNMKEIFKAPIREGSLVLQKCEDISKISQYVKTADDIIAFKNYINEDLTFLLKDYLFIFKKLSLENTKKYKITEKMIHDSLNELIKLEQPSFGGNATIASFKNISYYFEQFCEHYKRINGEFGQSLQKFKYNMQNVYIMDISQMSMNNIQRKITSNHDYLFELIFVRYINIRLIPLLLLCDVYDRRYKILNKDEIIKHEKFHIIYIKIKKIINIKSIKDVVNYTHEYNELVDEKLKIIVKDITDNKIDDTTKNNYTHEIKKSINNLISIISHNIPYVQSSLVGGYHKYKTLKYEYKILKQKNM